MKLKLDENGHVVVQEGKPVYVHDDGKEMPFDAQQALAKIGELNTEAKNHRIRAENAERKLEPFNPIEDPKAALKALEIVKNLDDKKLIDAGEVDKVKNEVSKVYEEKLSSKDNEIQKLQSQLHNELIGGSFARSKVVTDKLAIPADMTQAFFGRHFSINEDGKVIARDMNGQEIFSRVNPGQLADFDEALETLINLYPNKDNIVKSSGSQGGNLGNGGQAVNNSGLSRDKMNPKEKADYIAQHGPDAFLKLEK